MVVQILHWWLGWMFEVILVIALVHIGCHVWSLVFSLEKHRIAEWFALEGTFKDHLVQLPAMGRVIFHCISYSKPHPTWR